MVGQQLSYTAKQPADLLDYTMDLTAFLDDGGGVIQTLEYRLDPTLTFVSENWVLTPTGRRTGATIQITA